MGFLCRDYFNSGVLDALFLMAFVRVHVNGIPDFSKFVMIS